VLVALERAGLATAHVEGFAEDYAETLTQWLSRFEDHLDEAVRLAGEERVRVFRIYLRAARSGFRTGFTDVYQVRAHRP
jgi:cyclopropane-fatty-acyl-phospholipid synthase